MIGFYRIALCTPQLRVADPLFNAEEIKKLYQEATKNGASIVAFPELALTGASCGDLFRQTALLKATEAALEKLCNITEGNQNILIAGLPLRAQSRVLNAAVVIQSGNIVAFSCKKHLSLQEQRYFHSAHELTDSDVRLDGVFYPLGHELLFSTATQEGEFRFAIEFSQELSQLNPPSSTFAAAGAQLILNLAAEPELINRCEARKTLVSAQSARILGAYAYVGAGVHESTTDGVYSGHSMMAFNGKFLADNSLKRFNRASSIEYADFKPSWCDALRRRSEVFRNCAAEDMLTIELSEIPAARDPRYSDIFATPFIPDESDSAPIAREALEIQVAGLAKRIEHTHAKRLVLGVSGGLDSTLALLVCRRATDILKLPPTFTLAVTMPGFGTSGRTKNNAVELAKLLGTELREIPIADSVMQHFKDIGHDPENRNVVYENAQARERTQILMDLANAEGGLLVGTGDLSEIALGWSTFNGDHMSMYNVNCDIPKTFIRPILAYEGTRYCMDLEAGREIDRILRDICDTPVSPELLPGAQETESILGRYELHDFFLYYFTKYGEDPDTLFTLARYAFCEKRKLAEYATPHEIDAALKTFLRRFTSQQFKRNAAPEGPRVGSISLSSRTDWVAPSDASGSAFTLL